MERLTYRVNTGIQDVVLTDGKSVEECLEWKNVLERLAEYEDIGLTPEQLREIDKLYAEKCKELAGAQRSAFSGLELAQIWARLKKLTKYEDLEEQGKLLKLLCAVGDTYFEIETAFWRNKQECKGCRYYHTGSDVFRDDDCCLFEGEKWPSCAKIVEKRFENVKEIMSYMEDGSDRKAVFLTREEAEAALKEL